MISGNISVNSGQDMNLVTVIGLLFGWTSAICRSFIPEALAEICFPELADRQRIDYHIFAEVSLFF